MNVGKQSVKNDLEALDQKIEDVKNIKVEEVSPLTEGVLSDGHISDTKQHGVYQTHGSLSGIDGFGFTESSKTGMLFHMEHPTNEKHAVQMYLTWLGEVGFSSRLDGVFYTQKALTSRNTIVDANGFIKTA